MGDEKEGGDLPSRKERGNLKKRVTYGGRRLQKLVTSKEATREQVTEELRRVQADFKTFSEYHQRLQATLVDMEAKLSATYFSTAEAQYQGYVIVAEEWLEKDERGEAGTLDLESTSSSEEEEAVEEPPKEETPPSQGVTSEQAIRSTESGAVPATLDPTLYEFMKSITARLDKVDEFMKSQLATETPRGSSTPLKRGQYTPSRNQVGSLSTIMEHEDGQKDPLTVIQSMAESVRALAEKRDQSASQTIIREPSKPKFKMFNFSGEAIDYLPFIRAFESQVEARYDDPATCMGQLIDLVKEGPLRESLKFCALEKDPASGYAAAKEILQNRYGRYEDLAQAWMDKMAKIQPVRSVESLSSYISTLSNCQVALRAVDQLSEFETKTNLMALVDKLPRSFKERWQRRVVDIREEQNRRPRLTDVVKLLERIYLEKSDPIFGGSLVESPVSQRLAPRQTSLPSSARPQRINFTELEGEQVHAIQGGSTEGGKPFPYACTCCGGSHPMFRCLTFKDMNPVSRTQLVDSKKACRNCFHPRHAVEDCRSQHQCHVCKEKHHTMLHVDGGGRETVNAAQIFEEKMQGVVATTLVKGRVALPVVPIKVIGENGKEIETYALLDQGSTCSLVTQRLAERVGAEITPHRAYITTIDQKDMPASCGRTNLKIESKTADKKRYLLRRVVTKPTLNLSAKCRAYHEEITLWPHLKGIPFQTADAEEIDLLIGLSHKAFLFPKETRGSPEQLGPFAIRTILGWYIGGPMAEDENVPAVEEVCCATQLSEPSPAESLAADLERLWKVEGPASAMEKEEMSPVEKSVIHQWETKMKYQDGKYYLPIPFIDPDEEIPDNRDEAYTWFMSLDRALRRGDPEDARKYVGGMMQNIINGYAEKVPKHQLKGKRGKTRYLPHHPVNSPKKDKPRIVFNCAAKFWGKSLNDYIHAGPDLMNLLIYVLLRFRQDWIALLGDIEGMFNQIFVLEEDRDCLRFWFYEDGNMDGEIISYRMKTHLFGGVWSPSCANFTLQQVARDFGHEVNEKTVKMVHDNFYVDDGMGVYSTEQEAAEVYGELDHLLARGGFNFTKIASNSRRVLEQVPPEKLAKEICLRTLEFGLEDVKVVLGCNWRPRIDKLVFSAEIPEKPDTKRGVLSTLSSVYDPLGLVSPVVVKARMIFQDTCRARLAWDDRLTDAQREAWSYWKECLKDIELLEFVRCILPEGVTLEDNLIFDLHVFGDSQRPPTGQWGTSASAKRTEFWVWHS